jgi:hypothetical protein
MTSGEDGDQPGAGAVETLSVDGEAFRRSLFDGLAAPDRSVRRHAGYLLVEAAGTSARIREAVAHALAAWVVREPHRDAVMRTLSTLAESYDETVRTALLRVADQRRARLLYDRLGSTRSWEISVDPDDGETAVDVGAAEPIRVPSDVLRRYARDHLGDRDATTTENPHLATQSPGRARHWSRWSRQERLAALSRSEEFVAVEANSRFDEFQFLGPAVANRFGHAVQVRTLAGAQEDVAIVRLFPTLDQQGFERVIADSLREWAGAEAEAVIDVLDFGISPCPWAVVEYTERTLHERGQLDPRTGLDVAVALTGGLAVLHQRDLSHGGVDPHSVRFTASMFDETPKPRYDNAGLVPTYARFDDPSTYLDLRYAAPEHLTEEYGTVDRTTDVYGLGMVIYTAFTGDPPYEGNPADVRTQVLDDRPLGLSTTNPDLPGGLADVLATATAQEKIARYETATAFHQAIRGVRESLLE